MQISDLKKLSPSDKNFIKDLLGNYPDQSIIDSYTQKGFIIDQKIINEIRSSIEKNSGAIPPQEGKLCDGRLPFGIQIAKIDQDGNKESECRGIKDLKTGELLTPQTPIGIGSITKLYTAATFFLMIDQEMSEIEKGAKPKDQAIFKEGLDTKLIDFADKLSAKYPDCKYLEEIKKLDHYEEITIRHLLEHTAGLPHQRDNIGLARHQIQGGSLLRPDQLIDFKLPDPENEFGKHKYNNINFEILAMIVEVATDKKFEEVVKDKIIDRFSLENTAFKGQRSDAARSDYFIENLDGFTGRMDFTNNGNSWGSGGMIGTASDNAKFMSTLFAEDTFKSEAMKEELQKIRNGEGGAVKNGSTKNISGFFREDLPNGSSRVYHKGDNAGSNAEVSIDNNGNITSYAVTSDVLIVNVAEKMLEQQKLNGSIASDTKIDDKLREQKIAELVSNGFDSKKLFEMEGKLTGDDKTLQLAKSIEREIAIRTTRPTMTPSSPVGQLAESSRTR